MKRLDQMTMREYIDLRCGEHPDGVTTDDVARLVTEYQSICDPTGVRSRVSKAGGSVKDEMRIKILHIVEILLRMGYFDDAKSVYDEYSGTPFHGDADALAIAVKRKVQNLEFSMKRNADLAKPQQPQHELTPENIRRQYDAEVASLMAYHKMPISIDTITASVYAHLVCQTAREIKAKMAAIKKR